MKKVCTFIFVLVILFSCSHDENYSIYCCNLDPDSKDTANVYYITTRLNESDCLQSKGDTVRLKRYLRGEEFKRAFDTVVFYQKLS